jgi:HAD superfamily hydrolase (TIGR01549 family)
MVVLDVDGTLVDSNYHHVSCWARAFEGVGVAVPLWQIHRAIGMGGDRLVAEVAGDDVERQHGREVRDRWEREYDSVIDEVRLLPGARELLAALREHGIGVALASSSIPKHAEKAFDLLAAGDLADAATTSEDGTESKPDPELINEALSRVESDHACVVGDSVWDIEAARRAGLPAYGVLTGGTSRAELEDAGAVAVYEGAAELLQHLDDWIPARTA